MLLAILFASTVAIAAGWAAKSAFDWLISRGVIEQDPARNGVAIGAALLLGAGLGIGMGRPIIALFGFFATACLSQFVGRWNRERSSRRREGEALPFLETLSGLLRAGLGYSAALFEACREGRTEFSRAVRASLGRFQEGRSLSECLGRARDREAMGDAGGFLVALDDAYRRGLPIIPLLDSGLPALRAKVAHDRHAAQVRRQIVAQAILSTGAFGLVILAMAFSESGFLEQVLVLPGVRGLWALTGLWIVVGLGLASKTLTLGGKSREWRRGTMRFLEALELELTVGHEIRSAWRGVVERLESEELRRALENLDTASRWEASGYASWFVALRALHDQGAALLPAIRVAVASLRCDEEQALSEHARTAPSRANLILTLTFLPALGALLFLPLLLQLGGVLDVGG